MEELRFVDFESEKKVLCVQYKMSNIYNKIYDSIYYMIYDI